MAKLRGNGHGPYPIRHAIAAKNAALAVTVWALNLAGSAQAAPSLRGVVSDGGGWAHAPVSVVDVQGQHRQARTDDRGVYEMDATGLQAPLVVSVHEAGNDNCIRVDRPRARCMAAVLATLPADAAVANLNPFTDWIASQVALGMKLLGPQQLVDRASSAGVSSQSLADATGRLRAAFHASLREVGITDAQFDPATAAMKADHSGLDSLFDVIHHNRSYDSASGQSGPTVLTDVSFRPINGHEGCESFEPLDLRRAQKERAAIESAPFRVLIVGDSTAATYEKARLPRMGWGQVFESRLRDKSKVKVLNGARSGRSSRDFFHAGWYGQLARSLRKGDYVLIQLGHNDQNCDAQKVDRGAADVANLCTYPNDAQGQRQFPAGKPELSFQTSLERYIAVARERGAIPVLLTPTTRVLDRNRKPGLPVVATHVTRFDDKRDVAFVGDYAQTVRDTARANDVPVIDLEAATLEFVNRVGDPGWKDYWLVVDPARYPYYAQKPAGSTGQPDTTHFQEKGANAVADLVAAGIKAHPALTRLAAALK